ncbi:MAG: UDP-N-acetylglucosamine--N-acetylmuramyl-(pentapeptide) pyrophosphoryl-undecaprenol N-acetylglucosamine transferase [Gemmatimonadetes bacterium]|nr:UDP-N-acetylglucosamine--N-acetylmuramyl-(pentapeptide) pyrophosphoryl-undecaprenol N-acetylglucosamine transferase [Gemmatimonadota bacterium]
MNVVFAGGGTGGHLYPALAVARALVRLDPTVRPFFIGAERGIEKQILPTTEFPFALFPLHPVYRTEIGRNWRGLRETIGSWGALGDAIRRQQPAVVVGTGGYASGMALAWAIAHGVPTVQVVADAIPGITARATARWARALYLGFAAAQHRIGGGQGSAVIVTGNPIEPPPEPRPDRQAARAKFGIEPDPAVQVVLVFGGSQGSEAINRAVGEWLAGPLQANLRVIWGVGTRHFDALKDRATSQVRIYPYLSPIADAYAAADLAITRAGAMTCSELTAWGLPAILVPLPTAAADHQTGNARAIAEAGAGELLPQSPALGLHLHDAISRLLADRPALERMAERSRELGRRDAAQVIAKDILTRFS